jgi:hypothetical protein
VRPKGTIEFHAHAVEEAIHVEDEPFKVAVSEKLSTGTPFTATIHVPHAFPYLMMKLHAFNDRLNDADTDLGRHHALDLYAITGMMTEGEYERAKELGANEATNNRVRKACAIVKDHFASRTAVGLLRLREHNLFRDEFLLEQFISVLAEIFPGKQS